jgi:glycine hydroxymethyltransferase
MGEAEMARIANWIADVLNDITNTDKQARIAAEVRDMCNAFPVPGMEVYAEAATR